MPTALTRQLSYQFQRWILRREHMLATGLPLGMRLRFSTPDDVGRRIYKRRTHEPHILEVLREQPGRQQPLIFDVGANLGWYSILLDRMHKGRADIFAFEPDAVNLELLQFNLRLNEAAGIELVSSALSDCEGTASLHRYRDLNLGRHSLAELPGSQEVVVVETTTLDSFVRARGLQGRPVELLKIDVEGHEPEVIRGARDTLRHTRMLVLEYSPMYMQEAVAREMLEMLATSGLRPRVFERGAWRATGGDELLELTRQADTIWTRA